ncbi:ATP-dependent nuclease [Pseudoalteromonas xiamenensis]
MDIDTGKIRKIGKRGSDAWLLHEVRQMNFFIGPNNSGKSREVRSLFSLQNSEWAFDLLNIELEAIIRKVAGWLQEDGFLYRLRKIRSLSGGFAIAQVDMLSNKPICLADLPRNLFEIYRSPHQLSNAGQQEFEKLIQDYIIKSFPDTDVEQLTSKYKATNWKKMYIPTLRSLRQVAEEDIFEARTTKDYFPTLSKNGEIFTGHSLYEDLKKHLLGSHDKRQKVRDFERYLSENFFFGNDISLVPMVDKDVVYVKEGDDEDRPIYDLGDGIQSIIILTFKVFMAEEPTMFFIEEPEHYLHAGLQRTLIETFAKHKEHMFFMTTHSNHFLDLAQERDDVSIQQVSRINGETIVEPALELSDVLSELGVRASSVLLANCSIWVEGVTDKLYLRTYLKKYIEELDDTDRANKLKSLHENLHYVFTEYQGSNITHWDFSSDKNGSDAQTPAKKLSQNILLIADADIDGKGDRVKVLESSLGDNFLLLEWKEIENYIPFNPFLETAKRRWETFRGRDGCHIDNFKNLTEDKLKSETRGVGAILEPYVTNNSGTKRKFYKDDSGTIKDKVKFCYAAIEVMNESDDWQLTPELRDLCDKIWVFIEAHNY